MEPAYIPLGDNAITLCFGNSIDDSIHQKIIVLYNFLLKDKPAFIKDIIPAYTTLTVLYDVILIRAHFTGPAAHSIKEYLKLAIIKAPNIQAIQTNIKIIPLCYDPMVAPDINAMSSSLKLSVEEIILLHTAPVYKVYMIGFLPGFPYMGIVDKSIATPRKKTPSNIVAGSVGIAGNQTGIYSLNSPGGWNIIGQTPIRMFNKKKADPCYLQPGDRVKFQSISYAEFKVMQL